MKGLSELLEKNEILPGIRNNISFDNGDVHTYLESDQRMPGKTPFKWPESDIVPVPTNLPKQINGFSDDWNIAK